MSMAATSASVLTASRVTNRKHYASDDFEVVVHCEQEYAGVRPVDVHRGAETDFRMKVITDNMLECVKISASSAP